jgi:hypothetical protein
VQTAKKRIKVKKISRQRKKLLRFSVFPLKEGEICVIISRVRKQADFKYSAILGRKIRILKSLVYIFGYFHKVLERSLSYEW